MSKDRHDDPGILGRLRSVDWTGKPEPIISSQLITPVLALLGYGEHTLHKVGEQQSYKLDDPWTSKGSRRVKLDYEPRVYEEGLWVMEAKGTNSKVTKKTLGQVRDYAIHPEIRAALMVTVDAAGFRVFDPWDEHWAEPLLVVKLNEVADRIGELRSVLGVDHVATVVRRRHLDHLRRSLSASLEFGVLDDAEREFRALIDEARATISERRLEIHRASMRAAEELHQRVLRNSGAWGVAQHHNSPWTGSVRDTRDLAVAVLAQDERQRPTQIMSVWRAIEAVYEKRCPEGAELRRPLWWLHVVVLGGCLALRGEPGCEPYASDYARQAARDCLLGFPDDPAAAASWRLQRVAIPLFCRLIGGPALDQRAAQVREQLSAEQRIQMRIDPGWFLGHGVRNAAIKMLGDIDPWTPDELDRRAAEAKTLLDATPIPNAEWHGPVTEPWLESWAELDELLMCGLDVLRRSPKGDDLIKADPDLLRAIEEAATSEQELLRRPAVPLAERLGISAG